MPRLTGTTMGLQAEHMEAAEPYFERTWEQLQAALDVLPSESQGVKLKTPVRPPPPTSLRAAAHSLP